MCIHQVDANDDDDEEEEEEFAKSSEPVESSKTLDAGISVSCAPKKKTQKDRNKEKRRRGAEVEITAKQQLKKQRRDLEKVSDFQHEISHQEALQRARAIRKAITKSEKALSEPPKLGKHRFRPANIQVISHCYRNLALMNIRSI